MRSWILDNLGLKLLSLGLAVFLWAVVLGEQKIEVTVNVPLDLHPPANLVLVNDPPESLDVQLRGPRTLVSSLAPGEVRLSRPVEKLTEGENLLTIPPSAIRVPRGIEVLEVDPRRIRAVLEAMVKREVEVRPRVEGSLPDGYVLKGVAPTPARVTLIGPRSAMRRLTVIDTAPVSLDGHTASFTATVGLEPPGPQISSTQGGSVAVAVEIAARRS